VIRLDFTKNRVGSRPYTRDQKIVKCPKCGRNGLHSGIDLRGGHSVYHVAELHVGLHVRDWCYIKAVAWALATGQWYDRDGKLIKLPV